MQADKMQADRMQADRIKSCNERGDRSITEEKRALYLLNNIEGLYSDRLNAIRDHFGSFAEAWSRDFDCYLEAGLLKTEKLRPGFDSVKRNEERLMDRLYGLMDSGVRLIMSGEDDYPRKLTELKDPPALLYAAGRLPEQDRPAAAIIGARQCSEYGRSVAESFAEELSANGIQIVSGLAYGIDGAAARGSLKGAGESYGIIGSGINICYPASNREEFDRMRSGEGGIITEFPPDSKAAGFHFVMRNRIIAAFSDALLVIEAREKSGTSTTVDYALDLGREIFALPGRITDPLGYGCNRLIKQGASALTSVSDILEFFNMEGRAAAGKEFDPSALNEVQRKIYNTLDSDIIHMEMISALSGISFPETAAVLAELELMGLAVSPQNAYYCRKMLHF